MQELFADKPWVQPLAVAGSHVTETEQKENTLQEKRKMKHMLHVHVKYNERCNAASTMWSQLR